jgi:hypothetical protein
MSGGEKMSNTQKIFIPILIIVLSLSVFTACGNNSEKVKSDNPLLEDITFYDEFRNDKTGKWRKALIVVAEPAEKYAVDYYKDYFKSDDEIHFIYNFQLNTVNVLKKAGPDTKEMLMQAVMAIAACAPTIIQLHAKLSENFEVLFTRKATFWNKLMALIIKAFNLKEKERSCELPIKDAKTGVE